MINLVSLLVTAALISLQCDFVANAHIDNTKLDLDNNLRPNAPVTPRRRLKKFVHISLAPPERVRHVAGTTLELVCEVMGSPAPSVHWLKNGHAITDYEETNEILPTSPTSLAQITNKLVVSSSTTGDEYTCVATAGLHQETASTTVYTVKDNEEDMITIQKLFRMPSKPIITSYYTDLFQDSGSTTILPCRVFSYSKSQVFWQDRENNMIFNNSRMQVLPSGDLLITNLRWSDMGNFTCTAKNMYGKETVTTFVYPTKVSKDS